MPPLDSYDRALLDMTFKAFTEAMESSNVTYFIFAGTLLGSWRHHGRIPWDDDIDVMINGSDLQTVSQVLRSKVAEDPESFGLYETEMSSEGLIHPWKFYPRNGKSLSHNDLQISVYRRLLLPRKRDAHLERIAILLQAPRSGSRVTCFR